jgi:predicted MPP superfamily phosphohydrolase
MRRHVQFAVFGGVFLALSLIMNYYVFSHLTFMIGLDRSVWFWLLMVLSSLSWLIAMGLEMRFTNGAVRVYYIFASVWLGALFLFLFTLIPYDILRLSLPLDTTYAGHVVITLVGAAVAYGVVNARLLRVREVDVPSRKVEGELRVVHLTDLHIGSVYGTKHLARIVAKVNELRPDLVLITGDLADGPHTYGEGAFAPIDDLDAPVFLTTGNHEHFAGLEEVLALYRETKMVVLDDEVVRTNCVQVVGVSENFERDAIARVLDDVNLDPSVYTILMFHRPVSFDAARERGVDLMLAGHTHSGQFFPFQLLVRAIWKKVRGLYNLGGMYLYAGSGTGTWGPPMRLGTNSEIALLRIKGVTGVVPSVC